jgi:hypothetical protein
MIISDFNFKSIAITPHETDAILVVDPNAMLSFAIPLQGFQMVARKYGKIRKSNRCVDLHELSLNNRRQTIEAL